MLQKILGYLRKRESGQDLAESCLIIAFVALIALAVIVKMNGGIAGIWQSADSTTSAGATAGDSRGATPAATPSSVQAPQK